MSEHSRIFGGLSLPVPGVVGLNSEYAKTFIASGAIDPKNVTFVKLNSNGASLAMTIAKPVANQLLIITQIDGGTDGHTVTLGSGTFDGSHTIATFNAKYETLFLFGLDNARYAILENLGSVGLS